MLSSIDFNYTTVDILLVETVNAATFALLKSVGYWPYSTGRDRDHPNPPENRGAGPNEIWIHHRVKWGEPGTGHSD